MDEATGAEVLDAVHRVREGFLREVGVDDGQRGKKRGLVEHVAVIARDVRPVLAGVAHVLQKGEDAVFVVGFGEGHILTSLDR